MPTRAGSSRSRTPAPPRPRSTGSRSFSSTAATAPSTVARRSPARLAAGAKLVVDVDPQNGAPDGLALVDTSQDALLDALSYEGAIRSATIGTKVFDLVEGTLLPVDVADSNTVDGTLARIPDGADTDNAATDWAFTTTPTPGAANVETP